MPGVKRFDRDEALERGMEVFWRYGYEGTSVQILERETQVARSSLYATFGDKEALFLEALERYRTTCLEPVLAALDRHESTIEGLTAMLEIRRELLASPARPRGCLLTRITAEKGSDPGVVGRTVRQCVAEWENAVYAAVRRGQRRGEIGAGEDPRAAARFLVTVAQGMAVLGNLQDDANALRDVQSLALRAIGTELAAGDQAP